MAFTLYSKAGADAAIKAAIAPLGARVKNIEDHPGGGDVDLSGYARTRDLDTKASMKDVEALAERIGAVEKRPTAPAKGGRAWFAVSYPRPDDDLSAWRAWLAPAPLGTAVMDHSDHDWSVEVPAYAKAAKAAKAAGARVLWYVPTHKGMAGNPAKWGEGRQDAAKWSHDEIIRQLGYARTFYGADVFDGVFLDEVSSGLDSHAERVPWYTELITKLRERFGASFYIFGNPGVAVSDAMLDAGFDGLCTFEDTAVEYLKANGERKAWLRVTPAMASTGVDIVHMVRDVTAGNIRDVYERAEAEGPDGLFLTDRGLTPGADPLGVPTSSPYAAPPSAFVTAPLSAWAARMLPTYWAAQAGGETAPTVLVDSLEGGKVYDAKTIRLDGGTASVIATPTDTWRGDVSTRVFEVPGGRDLLLGLHVVHTGAVPASLQVKVSYGTASEQPRAVWTKGGSFTVDPTGEAGKDLSLVIPASDTQGNTHARVDLRFNGNRWEPGKGSVSGVTVTVPGDKAPEADLSAFAKKDEVAAEAQKAVQQEVRSAVQGLATKQELSGLMSREAVEAYVREAIAQALKVAPGAPEGDLLVPKPDPGWNNQAPYLAKFRAGEGKTSTMPITILGDSWSGGNVTERGGANKTSERWDAIAKRDLNNFAFQNQAISGQLTSDFLIYSGVHPFIVSSIDGDQIPAGKNVEKRVTLSSPPLDVMNGKLLRNNVKDANTYITYWQVTLDGVPGYMRLRWDQAQGKNYFVFARNTDGQAHPLPPGTYRCSTQIESTVTKGAQFIIELGINDLFQHYGDAQFVEKYMQNLRDIISRLGTEYAGAQPSHLMVLTIPPMSGEKRDAPRRKTMDKANAALVNEFGPMVLDISSYLTSEQALVDAGVPVTSGDREDLAQRSLPRSLMGDVWQKPGTFDATHMNAAGHKVLGEFIAREIKRRGWVQG